MSYSNVASEVNSVDSSAVKKTNSSSQQFWKCQAAASSPVISISTISGPILNYKMGTVCIYHEEENNESEN